MPRKPDPNLEKTIVSAAVRLLEKGGLETVTMREVAKAAGTTTPTLYERFKDRDALVEAITDAYRGQLMLLLDPSDSLEEMSRKFLKFCSKNPNAIPLMLRRMAWNLKTKTKGPIFEMVRNHMIESAGFSPKDAEEMTLATSSTIAGAALLMGYLGTESHAAKEVERATMRMMLSVTASNIKKKHFA